MIPGRSGVLKKLINCNMSHSFHRFSRSLILFRRLILLWNENCSTQGREGHKWRWQMGNIHIIMLIFESAELISDVSYNINLKCWCLGEGGTKPKYVINFSMNIEYHLSCFYGRLVHFWLLCLPRSKIESGGQWMFHFRDLGISPQFCMVDF